MPSILKLEDEKTNDVLNRSTEVPVENTSTAANECISLVPKEGTKARLVRTLVFHHATHIDQFSH